MPFRKCGNGLDWKKEVKDRKEQAPRAVPTRRKRALTLPLPLATEQSTGVLSSALAKWKRPQRVESQANSSFSRLPLEIRQHIYGFVLGHMKLHIVHLHQRLGHVECASLQGDTQSWGMHTHDCWGYPLCPRRHRNIVPELLHRHKEGFIEDRRSLLSLLLVCRRWYSEAIGLLYSTNTFVFRHILAIFDLSATTLHHRFMQIRSLQFSSNIAFPFLQYDHCPLDKWTWLDLWSLIARMDGLRYLHVELYGDIVASTADKVKILEPLRMITHVPTFQVRVPWPIELTAYALNDAPFTLETSGEDPWTIEKYWSFDDHNDTIAKLSYEPRDRILHFH